MSNPDAHPKDLLQAAAQFPDGASISQLEGALAWKTPRRTLNRRLNTLLEEGKLIAVGKGRGRRYLLPASPTPVLEALRLSPEAKVIQARVTRPLFDRQPVGYRRALLKTYEPNVTAYLSEATRKQLASVGKVGITNQPPGTYTRQLLDRLLVDLSWNSSRLEGNTYSLLETQRLFELGESAEGKAAADAQMILNHKAAIELLASGRSEIGFNRYTICNLHALLSDNLLANPAACGRVRTQAVGITGTTFHPLENPHEIDSELHQILVKGSSIQNPFELAFFAMVHLPYLRPFEDVNKRVSRLAANIPLIANNLCPLSFVDVPQDDYVSGLLGIYELNRLDLLRDVFVWAYGRSSARYSAIRQSLGDPDPFRLRHRAQIGFLVQDIVQSNLDKPTAIAHIRQHAETTIPSSDRDRFIEVVETELSSLHEGNIARYRLRPTEFALWQRAW